MWHTKKKCTQIQNGARLIWQYLSQIPVPHELQQEQITFANQIISAKKTGEDAVELEKQVNEIVYGFYCMANTDEIEAVEPSK